ncbi:styrene monooxygenase/indole monooxygenase family protein [Nocardia otitidiscaviarum]|uniref:styrene monooxygenase/indole monooxygenase family protein n=1 Tax=Nocardia otitidiscaviarum TaxID=1823 RepID=UPI00189550C1|nr:styrene monooxygenase/indole monooxygenase family protein [Nocardia otitidiscaviarum]MBF6180688.1 hypothetical protein [Nocardia otitidiscaviarum]
MTRVQVLGAGECGLPLARRLLDGGIPVTLVTDRDAEAVLSGSVTSTQLKFPRTIDLESTAGLGHWRTLAPEVLGIRFTMVVERSVVDQWSGRFSRPAQSVDQRTAHARWLTDFVAAGGELDLGSPSVAEIDSRAAGYDLTVVTRASGELAACFADDPRWTLPTEPARRMAVFYLDGVAPDPDGLGTYVALPGLGELVSAPALTGPPGQERRCETLLFAAIPGRPLDIVDARGTAAERWQQARELLDSHLPPAISARFRVGELTDAGATLIGGVTPVMRQPIGTLPSGRPILGGADVVCRMDPGGAQGANNAVHCGTHYGRAILDNPWGPFDRDWMAAVAEPWLTDIAHPAARWTLTLLDPPESLGRLMLAASRDSSIADAFAETFVHPAGSDLLAGTPS